MASSAPESQRREIDLLGSTVEYEVRHSSEATEPRIDIDIHGVAVIVPEADQSCPEVLLRENAAWVLDKQRSYEAHRKRAPDRIFEAGERFPVFGMDRELVVESRQDHALTANSIRLRQSSVSQSSLKRVLRNFYREQARAHFTDRLESYAERLDVEYAQLKLRNQRTRWGSCSTGGTISLNWRLVMAPEEIIDYLIVHELAHLTEHHHGAEFWALIEEYVPDYERRAAWLERNSTKLIFSEDDL
jgi:predicted metal-dependent hydrolase